jgi:hypothetical protein
MRCPPSTPSVARVEVDPDRLVDSIDVRAMLGWARGDDPPGRSFASKVLNDYRFPRPVISHPPEDPDHPRSRLWRLADVDIWLDRNRPGWRAHRPMLPDDTGPEAPTRRAHLNAQILRPDAG